MGYDLLIKGGVAVLPQVGAVPLEVPAWMT